MMDSTIIPALRTQIENLLTDVAELPKWVAVEDELPEGWERCLFYNEKRLEPYTVGYLITRPDVKPGEMWCSGGSSGHVKHSPYLKPTHWMPLPSPPQGD